MTTYHAVTCTDDVCDPTCERAIELGLPREPDLTEPVWAQLDLLALLEEAS